MVNLEMKEIAGVSNTIQQSKRDGQYIYWSLTIPKVYKGLSGDEFTLSHVDVIKGFEKLSCVSYGFQLEKGIGGYLHYQCSIQLKKKKRLGQIKEIFMRAHCEPSRSKAADRYSTKSDTRIEGPWIWPYKYSGEDLPKVSSLHDWQKYLIDIIEKKPDDRLVYWVIDEEGGKGKSTFCKYVDWNYEGALVCGGELKDIAFAITEMKPCEKNIFMFDIPRSSKNRISYASLESIKNGHFFSPKYESKKYIGPKPHVIVFSNFLPEWEKLSMDRWVVINL